MADRDSVTAESRFAACAFAGDKSCPKQRGKNRSCIAASLSNLQCLCHLSLNLWLPWHKRVEPTGNAKKMGDGRLISKVKAVAFQFVHCHLPQFAEYLQQTRSPLLHFWTDSV